MTKEKEFDYIAWKIETFNNKVGNLHEKDNINCKKCKNKGYIYELKGEDEIVVIECSCMKERKVMKELRESGLSLQFKENTLENYTTNEKWQSTVLTTAKEYLNEIVREGKKHWFYISGQVGSGKTHICTAISYWLIKYGYSFKYFAYGREMVSLQRGLQSFNVEAREKAERKMEELTTVDVLYIDDFLKATKTIDHLFELIDTRHANDKITILSGEKSFDEIRFLDEAIASRIFGKTTQKYWLNISKGTDKDYRRKLK